MGVSSLTCKELGNHHSRLHNKKNTEHIATLFTIAKTWKQPKCPVIKKMWYIQYIYNGIIFSHKKKKFLPITTWMDLDNMLRKINHMEKDKYHMISPVCGI